MGKMVLFIEDEVFTVRALAKCLKECEGYTVDLVEDLREAAKLLSSKKYDLLILDIMLPHDGVIDQNVSPKESGIAFVRELQKGIIAGQNVSENTDVPIVVLTAVVDPRSMKKIRELKPAVLLRKPVAWKEFLAAVQKAEGNK